MSYPVPTDGAEGGVAKGSGCDVSLCFILVSGIAVSAASLVVTNNGASGTGKFAASVTLCDLINF